MKKTLFVAALMVISVQARAVEFGISGGIRDWEGTSRREERATPQVMLTVGNTITPNSPFRLDAVVTAWTSEVHEQNAVYDESGWRVIKRTEEQPGYRIGMRAMLDNHKPNGIGKRPTRPIVGAGCYNKYELRDWGEQPNWIGNSVVETVLGIAVPVGLMSDLMILFGVEVELDETDRNYQYLSLGYRFSVWE